MTADAILEARALRKSYPEGAGRLEILTGVDLKLHKGEIVGLVGESGAGKTTLLNLLGFLDKPEEGSIIFNGADVTQLTGKPLAEFRGRRIGFLFQFHYLLSDFTALENIAMPGLIAGTEESSLTRKALDLLNRVGLSARASHYPSELSGGEQQRVAMLRALINDPAVVLADEPAGNLDEKNTARLLDLIFGLGRTLGQTFLIATHSRALADRCDRVLQLKNGKVIS